MFYVKTADRLQRTSTWMMNLEGGLDYLREVVIEDSLGLAETFEQEMNVVIDAYECEWKRTVESEERTKQFSTFINTDKADSQIVFVPERDQLRPATKDELSSTPTA